MPKIVNPGFLEFLQDSVKGLLGDMPWLKGRTLKLAGSIQEVKEFVDKAVMTPLCAVDLETTSLNSRTRKVVENGEVKRIPIGKIVGISLCYERTTSLYIPMNHIEDANLNIPEQEVLEEIRRLCANCVTVYHNMKFDGNYLAIHGVYIDGYMKFEDTQLLGRLYDAGQKDLKLKNLSARLLNQPMITFEEISKGKSFSMVSPQVGYIYAASDAMCTLDLYHYFMANDIVKEQKAIYNLEKRLVPVVMEMENNFIKVDVEYLKKIRTDLLKAKEGIVKEIYALVGREFNIGSTQQMGKILFDELKYRYPESQKTASGQYMTDNAVLEKIADLYPIVKKIMSYRSMEKVLGTYIENLLNNHDEDGCIKLGFHQSGTDTGRFSSPGGSGIDDDGYSGVNVQSIPKQVDESTPDIRRAFVARPGYKIVAADYENEELRVATNISNETAWIDAIRRGVDFHTATGALIAGKRPEDLDPKGPERKQGKMVNFLALYQGGPRSLAAKTKISETEAKRVLTAFFAGVPKLKAWINRSIALARREKKVKTVFGRVRPLDRYYNSGDSALESHADRCACNTHIQGCSADIMKTVMVRMYNWIHSENLTDEIRILITMHDELVFEIKEDKLDIYIPKIAQIMMLKDILQGILKWPIPLTVEVKYGDSWRVKANYFEEHPEAKVMLDEPIKFHQEGQIGGRYAIATQKDLSSPVEEAMKPAQTEDQIKGEPEISNSQGETGIKLSDIAAMEKLELHKEKEDVNSDSDDVFVYTLKELSKSNLRRLNDILTFLLDENSKNEDMYKAPRKIIRIKDSKGNNLSVTEYKFPVATFLGLARYIGI